MNKEKEQKEIYGQMDRCVICGEYVPEGEWACPVCKSKYGLKKRKK